MIRLQNLLQDAFIFIKMKITQYIFNNMTPGFQMVCWPQKQTKRLLCNTWNTLWIHVNITILTMPDYRHINQDHQPKTRVPTKTLSKSLDNEIKFCWWHNLFEVKNEPWTMSTQFQICCFTELRLYWWEEWMVRLS